MRIYTAAHNIKSKLIAIHNRKKTNPEKNYYRNLKREVSMKDGL